MKYKLYILLVLVHISCFSGVFGQTTSLVSLGTNGKLVYKPDNKGNQIPDFSGVGYKNSDTAIPTYAIVKTVYPVSGDNLLNVQTAINQVAAMPVGTDGFRGAILFKKGKYPISDTIKINASGIILMGEGNDTLTGTHFYASKAAQYNLFNFSGANGISISSSVKKAITDIYVPIGSKTVTVVSGNTFKKGNTVLVHRIPNQKWIDTLTMAQWGWTPSSYDIYYERIITAVNGNQISLDAPLVDVLDTTFCTSELVKYTSNRIMQCAIENIAITSFYASDTDENHAWEAVTFDNAVNCWARKLKVYYFGYSAVHIQSGASWITVDSCQMLDAKSTINGERRYSFGIDGQRCLVQNCYTRRGRHDYVTGSRTPGPNVFYNSQAILQNNDIGPHHRWATGILFDNIVSNGNQDVQNRESYGTGQGWSGGQIMFWNCKAGSIIIQDPPTDEINWAIGCISPNITNVGGLVTEPYGFVESKNVNITAIQGLYPAQLNERNGTGNKLKQYINFNTLPSKIIGDTDFTPVCSSTAGLPVLLVSLNTAVATIVNGKIHIVGVGKVVITATQPGDITFLAAPNYSQLLTVINPLPVLNINLIGNSKKNFNQIGWTILYDQLMEISSIELQKSSNEIDFSTISLMSLNVQNKYSYQDFANYCISYYRVKIKLINGESIYSNTICIIRSEVNKFIFPNPANDNLKVTSDSKINYFRIINLKGQTLIEHKTILDNSVSIDVSFLKSGHYFLGIKEENNDSIIWSEFIKL